MKTAIELAARLSARYLDTKQMLPDELAHESAAMLLQQAEQIDALEGSVVERAQRLFLKADAERYRIVLSLAYVGIAPHPKPHEVWCLRLPNPTGCNTLDAAIDAMKGKS